jgi:hypothetical protein
MAINERLISQALRFDSTPRFVNGVLGSLARHGEEIRSICKGLEMEYLDRISSGLVVLITDRRQTQDMQAGEPWASG